MLTIRSSNKSGSVKNRERSRSASKNKKQARRHRVDKGGDRRHHHTHHGHANHHNKKKGKDKKGPGSKERSSSHYRRRETPHFPLHTSDYLDKYKIEGLIADGTFGRCLKVSYKDSEYAAKVIKPVKKYIESAHEEIMLLKRMNKADNYEYSPLYIESFYYKEHFVIITSLLGDSLYKSLKSKSPKGFPMPIVRVIARDIITAVNLMHSKAFMAHTDLKPENIVFASPGRMRKFKFRDKKFHVPKSQRVKIIDYGNAIVKEDFDDSTINTRQFRAPEVILKPHNWDHRSDIWSIGCILMELFTGKLLFPTSSTLEHLLMMEKVVGASFPKSMIEEIRSKEVEPLFDIARPPTNGSYIRNNLRDTVDLSTYKRLQNVEEQIDAEDNPQYERSTFTDLIKGLLKLNPTERLSLEDALNHNFFHDAFDEEYEHFFKRISNHFNAD